MHSDVIFVLTVLACIGAWIALGYWLVNQRPEDEGPEDDRDDPPRQKPMPPHRGDGCAGKARPYVTVPGSLYDTIIKP